MKLQLKFSLLIPFLLVLFQTASYAATFTWTGNFNSEWNNQFNWTGGGIFDFIPNANDDVIIPTGQSNYPMIGGSVTESIRILSMVVESGATVTVASQGTLRVFGASVDGIENAGTITNDGTIRIRDTGARGLDNNSGATFTNNGTLDIGTNSQPTGNNGIWNRGAGTSFQNNGIINIEHTNTPAIRNGGSANFLNANSASINIGQNSGNISGSGVLNTAINTAFANSGTITIDNTSSDGIKNESGATFSNTATANLNIGQNDGNIGNHGIFNVVITTIFENSGTINIDNTSSDGIQNQNSATFSNTGANATINIGQQSAISNNGIRQVSSSSMTNNGGTIKIDRVGNIGIQLGGSTSFLNEGGGIIQIGQDFVMNTQGIGTGIDITNSTATFTNDNSLIQIDSTRTGENGITNEGSFTNQNGGKIEIGLLASIDSIGILNLGTFENSGDSIKIFNTGNDGINNQDTFNNAGIITIEDTDNRGLDNNSGATFTNNGTLNIGTNNQSTEGNGIQNSDATTSFQNNGIINMEQVDADGIRNGESASFINTNGASINIGQNSGDISGNGILNTDSTTIFTNSGTINIDNTSSDGIDNQDGATFSNTTTANLNIGQNDGNIRNIGVFNIGSSTTFDNSGTINIDNTANSGILSQSGANFSNTATANLNIGQNDGNIGFYGVLNIGSTTTFNNSGTINIDNTFDDGIDNQDGAAFSNTTTANLNIGQNDGNIGSYGVFNRRSATFDNSGAINIDNTFDDGILNQGGATFSNTANLNIGQHDGNIRSIGVFNLGSTTTFDNSGTINIDNTSSDGILNQDGATFSNTANANLNIGQNDGNIGGIGIANINISSTTTFDNSGAINIDNTSSDGILNRNGADFANTATANLNIGQHAGNIGRDGIANRLNAATFENSGTINIDNTSSDGVDNQNDANFSNTATANLNIGQNDGNIGQNGIYCEDINTIFTNSGTINIDQAASNFIEIINNAAFNNKGGSINIENSNNSSNSAIVLLDGSQFIDSTGTINLGQNQSFNETAFEIADAAFTGNDTTIIQCVGDFVIGTDGTVNGIGQLDLEGDWENSGTFTADSSLVTILGSSQSAIKGNSASIFFDLKISNSGDVVLENDVTVTRQLLLGAGQVNLGDNDFTLGNDFELFSQVGTSALVTSGTGEVISTIADGESRVFPVGNTNYTPLTIQNNGTSDDFSVQCLPEVLEDGTSGNAFTTNTVNTTWLIEEAVAGGTNATITAQWTSAEELLAFDRSNAFIARYTGTVWDGDVPTAASGSDPYTITRAGVTTFSPFAVGSSFEGGLACVTDDILLDNTPLASGMYSTQASIESSSTITSGSMVEFFAVEVIELKPGFHAQNGSDFSARIDDCELFFFSDETIEQRTDIVDESIKRTRLPLLFPNPVGQELNIRNGIGQAVIYNMLGQQIQAFEIRDQLYTLDVNALQSGQYILVIFRENGEPVTLSFVK